MLKTISSCALVTCLVLAGSAAPAYAQRQAPVFGSSADVPQTVNFHIGMFIPRGEGSRDITDVLVTNCNRDSITGECTYLKRLDSIPPDLDLGDFTNVTFGAEWLVPIGRYVEFGAGASFYKKTVTTEYVDFVDSDGTPIEQELSQRLIPLSFTGRVLPLGQSSPVQPYVGGGINLIFWNYSETGEFIDFGTNPPLVFEDDETFEDSGTIVAPVLLGGLRYATDAFSVGGEFRYQWAEADLEPGLFSGTKIDFGGWTILGTIGFRF